jgi:hypothetical protein
MASLLSKTAGDIRQWESLPDLSSIQRISALSPKGTSVLLDMLVDETWNPTLKSWLRISYEKDSLKGVHELELKLL